MEIEQIMTRNIMLLCYNYQNQIDEGDKNNILENIK